MTKQSKKPRQLEPVKPGLGLSGGWDLSEVEDDYLVAELIRRGRSIVVQQPIAKESPRPARGRVK